MHKDTPPPSTEQTDDSPLSLSRLREAFAAMLKPGSREAKVESPEPQGRDPATVTEGKACEVNPASVVEAILFVGRPDNRTFSARELAAAMRGVSPAEVDAAVEDLNSVYDTDETPYRIEGTNLGYRLVLRDEFGRIRDKLHGRVREAKLSTSALEVLSIIAYNQPATADEITQLRGAPSGAALSTLVRRRLIRLDRPGSDSPPRYWTTERFLKLFGLQSLDALPRSEELEKV